MELENSQSLIAWGSSKLLELFLKNEPSANIMYIVDSNPGLQGTQVAGIDVIAPESLPEVYRDDAIIVVFAVSNLSIQSILKQLNTMGHFLHKTVFLYADLFRKSFEDKLKTILKRSPNKHNYHFVKTLSAVTHIPVHTTLLGNWLFLELLEDIMTRNAGWAIAEIGAYAGGNALLALLYMTRHVRQLPFFILDSFGGFPEVSEHDPRSSKAGDYQLEIPFQSVLDTFSTFPNAHVIKGAVPESFEQLDTNNQYGLVFYDCDLYRPAKHTFEYFWDRIIPGGYLLVHDYYTEAGGFEGVRRATDEFFGAQSISFHGFWETTMSLIIKP